MPTRIDKGEALARIRREAGEPACLMCALLAGHAGPVHYVAETEACVVLLSRYATRFGHAMVVPRAHVTHYLETPPPLWQQMQSLAHELARVVERVVAPPRVYVAALGSAAGELTQTSEHLHVHVMPVESQDDRPSHAFSWRQGVWVADENEWSALKDAYRKEFSARALEPLAR
jgi:histidine triad (HIT) family protein